MLKLSWFLEANMVTKVVSNLMESNVFVVGDEKTCVVVDAGADVQDVAKVVGERKVLGVLLTHGHYDHAYFAVEYAKQFSCEVYGSKFLKEYLSNPDWNYSDGHFCVQDYSAFVFLTGNGVLRLGNYDVSYSQLGGHSKSDMCFKIGDHLFVGDVLIGRDMGRIDLYGGDKQEMKKSLQFLLDGEFEVMHSGHGADNNKSTQDKVCKLWLKFLSR